MVNITLSTPDNFQLAAIYSEVPNSKKGIVLAHGMTVNKEDEGIFVRADEKLQKMGFNTLRFDFRAHGQSTGDSDKDFTISGELADLTTAVKFMQDKGMDWIGLAGASFGGGITALYAGQNPDLINALLLANPALDYNKCFIEPTTPWAKKHFANVFDRLKKDGFIQIGSRQFKVGLQLFEEMKSYFPFQELKKYHGPLLIIHGDKDSKVTYQDALDAYEDLDNQNKRFEVVEGSEHGFHEEPYETNVTDMIVQFFKKESQ